MRIFFLAIVISTMAGGCAISSSQHARTGEQVSITSTADSIAGFEACKLVMLDGAFYIRTETTVNRTTPLKNYDLAVTIDGEKTSIESDKVELVNGIGYAVFAIYPLTFETVDFPIDLRTLHVMAKAKEITIEGPEQKPAKADIRQIAAFLRKYAGE